MFRRKVLNNFYIGYKLSMKRNLKVCNIGGAGGIGQPLSLLLKLNPYIDQLCVYDVANAEGVAVDLSHIESSAKVYSQEDIKCALKDSDIVVIPAGVPRKPGMKRDDLFTTNCTIIEEIMKSIAEACPKALIAIITNPVNSIVPLAAEILKEKNVFDKNKLFGVTTLDIVRARTFIATVLKTCPSQVDIPVIGGHAGKTILPILSQCMPKLELDELELTKLTERIQDAGTEVVEAKKGAGSATLSMAYAAASFINSLVLALKGKKDIQAYAFVESCLTEAPFFSNLLTFGKSGIECPGELPELNDCEKEQLNECVKQLIIEHKKGIDFLNKKC